MAYKSIFKPGLFKDDVALVTGGGTGIGRCIAHELASLGATVIIAGRKIEKLQSTAQEMRNAGYKVDITQLDIRNLDEIKKSLNYIISKHGKLTCLVNNAGGQFAAPASEISPNGWKTVIDLNLNGTWMMCWAAYHAWMGEHGGRIVNITAAARNGIPFMAHTAAARAGIMNLTKTLCVEWAPHGIRINSLAPGTIVGSGMTRYPISVQQTAADNHWMNPSGRYGTEAEVSSAVVYLLSPGAAYINGITVRMDGGRDLSKTSFQRESKIPIYDGGLSVETNELFMKLWGDYKQIGKSKL
ncbi:6217_t:CDS:2 [Paraglomus brasilianum]|uniref:Peroxisomal trans-2-enoyl-CoA reductase n=1 Tax=Paraglomus brasilianum TaxID=144538 RepID=A0A9N9GSH6_9GLOM|nr:6217_t:CDS:2 [Paraglomus brasilianum]